MKAPLFIYFYIQKRGPVQLKKVSNRSRKGKLVYICVSLKDHELERIKRLAERHHGGNVSLYLRSKGLE